MQKIVLIVVNGPQREIASLSQDTCSLIANVPGGIVNFVKIEIMIVSAWQKLRNAQKIPSIWHFIVQSHVNYVAIIIDKFTLVRFLLWRSALRSIEIR